MFRSVRRAALWGAAALMMLAPAAAGAAPPERLGSLTEVGHEPLMNRGMNAALAVHGDYAYIGSRTDGGHEGMPHGGVMIVDISAPEEPTLLTETPILNPAPGESTRELRVWRSQDVLIVLNTNCGVGDALHHCTAPTVPSIRFYDIRGENATDPQLLTELTNVNTHEFFLWEDPHDPGRALIFAGNAGGSCSTPPAIPTCPFAVWDISNVRSGQPRPRCSSASTASPASRRRQRRR